MTTRFLYIWCALTAALVVPARANDDHHEAPAQHADAAPVQHSDSGGGGHSTAEPALAEPSAAEPDAESSHHEAAPPESAPLDYSSSESYPGDDGGARSESSGSSPRSHEEDRPAEDDSENKKGKKAKPYDYERSKYKSRELSDNTTKTYRFNAKGEPVGAEEKKKPVAKKTKRSSSRSKERKPAPQSCGSADSCAEKKSDADAL